MRELLRFFDSFSLTLKKRNTRIVKTEYGYVPQYWITPITGWNNVLHAQHTKEFREQCKHFAFEDLDTAERALDAFLADYNTSSDAPNVVKTY